MIENDQTYICHRVDPAQRYVNPVRKLGLFGRTKGLRKEQAHRQAVVMRYDRTDHQAELEAMQYRGRLVHVVVRIRLDGVKHVEIVGNREIGKEFVLRKESGKQAEKNETAQDQTARRGEVVS